MTNNRIRNGLAALGLAALVAVLSDGIPTARSFEEKPSSDITQTTQHYQLLPDNYPIYSTEIEYMRSFSIESVDPSEQGEDNLMWAIAQGYKDGKPVLDEQEKPAKEFIQSYPVTISQKYRWIPNLLAHIIPFDIVQNRISKLNLDRLDQIHIRFKYVSGKEKEFSLPESLIIDITPQVVQEYTHDYDLAERDYYEMCRRLSLENGVSSGRY